VLDAADDYLGTRYLWGGDSPETGFDCSGFVQYVYARRGVRLPRTSRQMAAVGWTVEPRTDAMRAGDLLFFAGDYRTIDHVAIYAGGGTIVHSSSSAGGVVVDRLSTDRGRWFTDHLVAVRRVVEQGRSLIAADADPPVPPGSWDPPDRAPRRN
jgi:cell wall-associated NlpC family hydrolase